MGELPWWYQVIRAARVLGVAPWELMDRPVAWVHWALKAESVEAHAHGELRKQANV